MGQTYPIPCHFSGSQYILLQVEAKVFKVTLENNLIQYIESLEHMEQFLIKIVGKSGKFKQQTQNVPCVIPFKIII